MQDIRAVEIRCVEERDAHDRAHVRVEARSWSPKLWRFRLALALGLLAGLVLLALALLIAVPLLLGLGLVALALAGLDVLASLWRSAAGRDRQGRRNVRVIPPASAPWR
ncbi:MAG: hypothetical protein D6824_06825 [Planctomycetota bacterium]|nr:MAG: hypothetical protein D6824_06825 [Planctomycetota bacterium]